MREICFIFVLFILAIIHFTMLHNHNVRSGRVGIYSIVMFLLLIYYDMLPMVFFASERSKLSGFEATIFDCSIGQFILAEICIILFTFFFHITYYQFNNYQSSLIYEVDEVVLDRWLKRLGIFSFLVGAIALFIFIMAFGGIEEWYSRSNIIRSFAYSADSYISHFESILIVPAKLVLASPLLLYPIMKKRRSFLWRIIFSLAFIFSYIFLFGNAGKTDIIIFSLCFAIPFLQRHTRHPWRITVIMALIAIPFIEVLDAIFDYLTFGIWNVGEINLLRVLKQFAYPYCDVLHMGEIVEQSGLRFGKDFITGILSNVPGLHFEASYIPVSAFFGGENWKYTGGTPNEIITFGFQQFGVIGVILMAILFGVVCGKLDRVVEEISVNRIYAVFSVAIIVNIFTYMLNADIYGLVSSQFALTLPAFCALMSCRVKKEECE